MSRQLEVFRRPKGEQRSEFEAVDYLHSPRSEQEFRRDLESLLREYLRAPSVYEAYLTTDGELTDGAGNRLTEMVDEAVRKRIGQKGYERTWAEAVGVYALQALYGFSGDDDLVVLASPPGLPEEGFGQGNERMSMTGISTIKVGVDGTKKITTYTIPIPEILPDEHVIKLKRVVGEGVFETVVGEDLGDHPDRHLVSRPIRIIEGIRHKAQDKIARELGYDDFGVLVRRVEEGLRLKDDEVAEGRRIGLTSFIAKQIVLYREKQDEAGLRIAGKVVRMMFALEASGEYVGWDLWKTINEFKDLVKGFRVREDFNQIALHLPEDRRGLERVEALFASLQQNKNAQLLLIASSCGGGAAWQDMFGKEWRDMPDFSRQNIIQDILEKKEESYSFDHEGKCVVCKVDPKKLGPCQICEDCDKKIRSQVE